MSVIVLVLIWTASTVGFGTGFPSLQKQMKLGLDISGGIYVVLEAQTNQTGDTLKKTMEQTQLIIEKRVNEMGMSEPVVTIEGEKRIRVELPGLKDGDEALEQIGQTAQLAFRTADGQKYVDGKDVADASIDLDNENGGYLIKLKFTDAGGQGFEKATAKAAANEINEDDCVLLYETPTDSGIVTGTGLYPIIKGKKPNDAYFDETTTQGINTSSVAIVLDKDLISMPTCKEKITGKDAVISGSFTQQQANNLALLIRGGALPVELQEVESSQVGASIGIGALKMSIIAGAIGILLIFLLMLFLYRVYGLAANVALLLYVPLVLWIIIAMKGVLTLPGIAGIILSIGMAVDANVIVFARIKEEAAKGKSVGLASEQGFKRALPSILDSQITTLIAALVLYQFGTGSVKGFALTLLIGIFVGLFTALIVAQIYIRFLVSANLLKKKWVVGFSPIPEDKYREEQKTRFNFSFIKNRKIYYIATVAIMVIGIGTGVVRGYDFGIDFTGGTRIQITTEKAMPVKTLKQALAKSGIKDPDITSVGNKGKTYLIKTTKVFKYEERNGIQDDILVALGGNKKTTSTESSVKQTKSAVSGGAVAKKTTKKSKVEPVTIDSFEQFGPSIGRLITQNAITSIIYAAIGMLIYVFIRFRLKFAVASLLGVLHDVIIMIAFYGLFHVTINSPFIAAILTVVGYSINDTIVTFDRVRENRGLLTGKDTLSHLVDTSINQTLVRSIVTSVTTLLAMLPLVILGGEAIREFTMPLMVGVLTGCLSSIFIATSLYYDFAKKEFERGKKYFGAKKKSELEEAPPAEKRADGAVV